MKSNIKRAPKSLKIIEALKAGKSNAQIRASYKVQDPWINILRKEEGYPAKAPATPAKKAKATKAPVTANADTSLV